jgi:hypothetical protein
VHRCSLRRSRDLSFHVEETTVVPHPTAITNIEDRMPIIGRSILELGRLTTLYHGHRHNLVDSYSITHQNPISLRFTILPRSNPEMNVISAYSTNQTFWRRPLQSLDIIQCRRWTTRIQPQDPGDQGRSGTAAPLVVMLEAVGATHPTQTLEWIFLQGR